MCIRDRNRICGSRQRTQTSWQAADRTPLWKYPAACFCRTDEPIASTMRGFNKKWRPGIIAEALTNITDGYLQNSFADKGSWPDCVEEFLFRDELARVLKKVTKYLS